MSGHRFPIVANHSEFGKQNDSTLKSAAYLSARTRRRCLWHKWAESDEFAVEIGVKGHTTSQLLRHFT